LKNRYIPTNQGHKPMSLPNEESIALGARLQAVRIANGYMKAADFQKKFNLSPNMHYQWETGRRIPSDAILLKLSKTCKVSFEWLKKGKGDIFQGVDLKKDTKDKKSKKKSAIEFAESSAKEKLEAKFKENLELTQKHKLLNQELLTAIIEKLTQAFVNAGKPVNPKQLSQFTTQAYTNIILSQPSQKQQINLLDLTLNAYQHFIRND